MKNKLLLIWLKFKFGWTWTTTELFYRWQRLMFVECKDSCFEEVFLKIQLDLFYGFQTCKETYINLSEEGLLNELLKRKKGKRPLLWDRNY